MHSNTMMMGCVLVAIVGSASPGLSQEAVLSTDRTSYLQHEPVELRIDYVNRSTTPLTTQLDPVWLSVSQPGGVPRRVGLWQDRLSEVDDRSPARATIQPGETYRRIIWVALDRTQAWVFPSIGRWQVGVESLRAVPIEIAIVEPDGGEVAKAALLFGPKACASFLSNGNDVEGSASTLQDIVDKYPRTTFASFAAWSLVQNQWAHHAPADIDWTKERAWVSVILQGPQDHPLRPAAMYAVVRYHQFQKSHKDQARKAADDLARAYPWSTWAHAVRRDFGQDVSAKLVPYSEDPAVKRRREASEKRSDTSPAEKPPAGSHSSKASPMPARTAAASTGP